MELNDHLRQMLKDLGQAINESISGSGRVHESIQRIRDEGYNLYMVLDAKVGVNKESRSKRSPASSGTDRASREERAAFRINLKDLHFLRSMGIDPTVKVRNRRVSVSVRRSPGRRAIARAPRSE